MVQGMELFQSPLTGQLYLVTRKSDGEYSVHQLEGRLIQTFHRKHAAVNAINKNLLDTPQ